jgi:hypothetical protein
LELVLVHGDSPGIQIGALYSNVLNLACACTGEAKQALAHTRRQKRTNDGRKYWREPNVYVHAGQRIGGGRQNRRTRCWTLEQPLCPLRSRTVCGGVAAGPPWNASAWQAQFRSLVAIPGR